MMVINNFVMHRKGIELVVIRYKLGDMIIHKKTGDICKIIQPTRKGFNIYNESTNKCLLRSHLYNNKRYNKEGFIHSMCVKGVVSHIIWNYKLVSEELRNEKR